MHWKAPFRENASFTYFAVRTCAVTLVTRDGRGGSRRISPSCRRYCGRPDSEERELLFRVFTVADRK